MKSLNLIRNLFVVLAVLSLAVPQARALSQEAPIEPPCSDIEPCTFCLSEDLDCFIYVCDGGSGITCGIG